MVMVNKEKIIIIFEVRIKPSLNLNNLYVSVSSKRTFTLIIKGT